jgi:hypothetical protein
MSHPGRYSPISPIRSSRRLTNLALGGALLASKPDHLCLAMHASEDRYLVLRDARELVDLLEGVGRHDHVALVRLERWLRARGYDDEPDRVA